MNFVIDFSWSIEQWTGVLRQLLETIQSFFADLGIALFKETEVDNANG